jgi:hypothetical protein
VSEVADHLAVALTAGVAATKSTNATPAIKDRLRAFRRALEKRGAGAENLEAAAKDRESILIAKELLGLIKLDDAAREAVEIEKVETSLLALSALPLPDTIRHTETPDVKAAVKAEAPAKAEAKPKDAGATPPKPKAEAKPEPRAAESKPEIKPPPTSRHFAPPSEPSLTELERTALPIWQRTDRFFFKVGIVVASYVVIFIVYWFFIRTPSNDAMDRCREGEAARCWEAVAAQDTVDQGKKVSSEPLQLLCEKHDPCGCAGVAYLKAAETTGEADCSGFAQATSIDPTWPCSCARYNFWRYGKAKSSACGIARCE